MQRHEILECLAGLIRSVADLPSGLDHVSLPVEDIFLSEILDFLASAVSIRFYLMRVDNFRAEVEEACLAASRLLGLSPRALSAGTSILGGCSSGHIVGGAAT